MRPLLMALCRLLVRLFFRKVVVVARDRVPADGPVLFVLNHPSGLVDPLLILCTAPRAVSFLAKAPLFRTPVVRYFVTAFQCLPVYRQQDGADPKKNREIIERSVSLLEAGNALAIFPEGTSHSDPRLKPLKTGAARIALSASAPEAAAARPVSVVPVGLYYTAKTTFRSEATLFYGDAIQTPRLSLDDTLQPPRDAVASLTEQIRQALDAVTLQADTAETLSLAESAETLMTAAEREAGVLPEPTESAQALEAFQAKRQLLEGYAALSRTLPGRVQELVTRIRRFEAQLEVLDLPLDQPPRYPLLPAVRYVFVSLIILTLGAPLALAGLAVHYPAYVLIDHLAHRMAKGEADVLASLKLVAGLLLFPASWLLASGVVWVVSGGRAAALGLLLWPVLGYAALGYTERLADFYKKGNAAWRLLGATGVAEFLRRERREIRAELRRLAELVPPAHGPS